MASRRLAVAALTSARCVIVSALAAYRLNQTLLLRDDLSVCMCVCLCVCGPLRGRWDTTVHAKCLVSLPQSTTYRESVTSAQTSTVRPTIAVVTSHHTQMVPRSAIARR